MRSMRIVVRSLLLVCNVGAAQADQPDAAAAKAVGGPYVITQSTIANGVDTIAGDARYRMQATVGQPETGLLIGGRYGVQAGFWVVTQNSVAPIFGNGFE